MLENQYLALSMHAKFILVRPLLYECLSGICRQFFLLTLMEFVIWLFTVPDHLLQKCRYRVITALSPSLKVKNNWIYTNMYRTDILCTKVNIRNLCWTEWYELHTLQMKGRWKSYINVWFSFMYSQKWNCYFQNRIIMFCLPVPSLIYPWEIYIFPGYI
jgi:hypothetical protein